jgi:hypothetical protein
MTRDPLRWSLSIAVLAIAGFVCWCLSASHEVIQAQKGAATKATHEEFAKSRTWLKDEVLDKIVVPQLRALAQGIDGRAASIEKRADARIGEAIAASNDRLNQAITAADGRLKETTAAIQTAAGGITTVAGSLAPAIDETKLAISDLRPGFRNASLMTANVQEAIAPNLECKGNGACWPSKATAILGGVATMTGEGGLIERAWRKEAPATAANVRGITGNAEKISHPHWYWKVAPVAASVGVAVLTRVKK